MDKETVIRHILEGYSKQPKHLSGTFFAPSNIALCKYWGKKDAVLNLPTTSSLSISLDQLGARTTIRLQSGPADCIVLNGQPIDNNALFARNFSQFLDLFRFSQETYFSVKTDINIPVGAGLASSACGFAAAAGAMDALFGWQLSKEQLSIMARLGSGSASRSFWHGFVEWRAGDKPDGMDSHGIALDDQWSDLRIGLLVINASQKSLSSRVAMQQTVCTSPFYANWPVIHKEHLAHLKESIKNQDFLRFGRISETNALAMHAVMLAAIPPILYSEPKTIDAMRKVWRYREEGLALFFTQDAGPNLKLLFLKTDAPAIMNLFPDLIVVSPFRTSEIDGR